MKRDEAAVEFMPRQVFGRHWVWLLFWLGAGIFFAGHAGASVLWLAFPCAVAAVFLLVVPIGIPRRAHLGTALLCLAFGAALYVLRAPGGEGDALGRYALTWPRVRHEIEGTVISGPIFVSGQEYATFVMEVDRVSRGEETLALSGRTQVRWTRPAGPVFAGTRVRVSGRLSPHLGVVNHGVRGMEDYYRARRIYSQLRASGDAVVQLAVSRLSPRYWAARLRQGQHERLSRVIPAEAYPFVLGVWLGERGHINQDMYQQFIYAGTAHVLSVSGVHVAIITMSLGLLLHVLRIPGRWRNLLLMAAVLAFTLMTGARTPTARAALMICLYLSAEVLDREPDALSVLGLTGCLFLSWNPALLFDTGFLLSFGSVASILLFYAGISRRLSFFPLPVRGPVATTLSAQAVSFPVAAWHFGTVPLLGIVANLAVIPLLTGVLWLCLFTALIGMALPGVASIFGHALLPLVKLIEGANAAVLYLPGAYTTVARPGPVALGLYAAALVVLFLLLYSPDAGRRGYGVMALLFLASLAVWNLSWKRPGIDFIDVGTGDSIFLRTPGGTTLLVDGGDVSEYTDAGERVVVPFLRANGIRRLDYVVVTHPDRDHIGGLFHVLDHIPVGTVLMGPEGGEVSELERAFLEKCTARGVPVRRLARGDSIPVEDAEILVRHPTAEWVARHKGNNNSLVLQVAWPGISVLLPGDVEEEAEAVLIAGPELGAAILKAPHHGSPTSSSEAFLEGVGPAVAIASMQAAGSRQTLMTPAMVQRYADHDITLFRTDWHGGVRIEPAGRGERYRVLTARGVRGYCLKPITQQ
ncbi:MAG: DNA internalization-related competence protein ComEC/Rec2 [Candidatus Hydrogenedentes bacterium]|nr:DNA internalization-related competence protein ComEC/Rec2 [Candidatus Hydrogenedentota bacterium]